MAGVMSTLKMVLRPMLPGVHLDPDELEGEGEDERHCRLLRRPRFVWLQAVMKLEHPTLVKLLQKAYSAERAAALAYIGHAGSLRDAAAMVAVKQIEDDEWKHRENILGLMKRYEVPVSRWYEVRFYIIGRIISASCYVIGRFMPFFFAGKLESGNVCEYFVMMRHFHSLGIREHDAMLYEMGMKEKEHEVYFLAQIKASRLLPLFEWLFSWGIGASANDVNLQKPQPVEDSGKYCEGYGTRRSAKPPGSVKRTA
jgi:hypothetical protein